MSILLGHVKHISFDPMEPINGTIDFAEVFFQFTVPLLQALVLLLILILNIEQPLVALIESGLDVTHILGSVSDISLNGAQKDSMSQYSRWQNNGLSYAIDEVMETHW